MAQKVKKLEEILSLKRQDGLRGLSNAAKHVAGGFSHIIDAIFSIF